MGRRRVSKQKEHITNDILLDILKAGALLTVALIAPNAVQYITSDSKKELEDDYYHSSISRKITHLWRRGLVVVRQTPSGHIVEITSKGKTELLQYDLDSMSIEKQHPWDGKWRMVFFDITKEEEQSRNIFREHLKVLGFYQMQKSVYIHPYPCFTQLQYIREVYSIPHSVKLATIEKLENDIDLRRIFSLV